MKFKAKPEKRQYPRDVWVLTPAYMVKQVTVTKKRCSWSGQEYGDETAEGKSYSLDQMHESKASAIASGRKQIDGRRDFLVKQVALLDARAMKLDKAEAS